MNRSPSLPPVLGSKLSRYRRRIWIVKMTEGILAGVFGLAISYLAVLVLDRFIETPAWLRGIFLVLGAAVPGLGLPLKWHRWVWRQRRLEDAARMLRWKFPRLSDRLLGIVELAKQDSATHSARLVEAAMDQAEDSVKEVEFTNAVPKATHRKWAAAAVFGCLLIAAGAITINEAARNALPRWLMPWKDTERFTYTRVTELPNPLVVPEAEPFTLPVNLSEESQWEPKKASGRIAGQDWVSAERKDTSYVLEFPAQKGDSDLKLHVGDVRETVRIEPRPRPELTGLKVKLKLPNYLQYETQPEVEVRGGGVSIVEGAMATVEATTSRELDHATLDGKPITVDGDVLRSAARKITEPLELTFAWKDVLGLTPKTPLTLKVSPAQDEAPRLVARRDSLEQVVLVSELITFDIIAKDDFGIRKVGLKWVGQSLGEDDDFVPAEGSKIVAAGKPEQRQIEARATFSATREGIEPQTIAIHAWAEDYYPDRRPSPSAVFILHILSRDDHAAWVTQQMSRWLEAARETYEREQQLHATNKELRALDPKDLERPDNRQKIADQASAETANAERLNSLTDSGRKLVEHATKNDEFDAERLESWALMLEKLDEIAKERMPSVADLLKQAADAKASKPGANGQETAKAGNSKPGKPGEGKPGKPGEGKPGEPGEQEPGDQKPGEQTANNDDKGEPKPGESGKPGEGESAPSVKVGPDGPKKPGGDDKKPGEGEAPKPVPSIAIKESTMNKPKESAGEEPPPGKPGEGKLSLPGNSLAAHPTKFRQPTPPPQTPQEGVDQAIDEQRDLLAEFAKVSDQLNEILLSLESSTFVKRLKKAARNQVELAGNLNERSLQGFGLVRNEKEDAAEKPKADPKERIRGVPVPGGGLVPIKPAPKPTVPEEAENEIPFVTVFAPEAFKKAKTESQLVRVIQNDLAAYFQRRADPHVRKVLDEMRDTRVVRELAVVGKHAADNYSGNAIHAAELWGDTMDRWAEEMVKIGKGFC